MGELKDWEIEIVIPKKDNSKNPIDPEYLNKIVEDMTRIAGGISVFPTVFGCWVNSDGSVECDENMIIKIDTENREIVDKIKEYAKKVGNDLGQEVMFVEMDRVDFKLLPTRRLEESPYAMKVRINVWRPFIR